MIFLRTIVAITCLSIAPAGLMVSPAMAQGYTPEQAAGLKSFAERLNRSARAAALSSGAAHVGAIACDDFVCTCDGAFDCAWLAYGCGKVGGVQGFDGECYLPGRDPEANRAVLDLRLVLLPGPLPSTCDGIFCSCSGGANSEDCQNLSATCIDDVSCIGDNCGCIGGTPSE